MNFLITAGPTREHIDPVRFLSNRSSGKMGYAIARAAHDAGHSTRLISGPVSLKPPEGVGCVNVTSADQMSAEVHRQQTWCDVLVMAAAVADWRPVKPAEQKTNKGEMPKELLLEPTIDILASLIDGKEGRFYVGFAAQTHNLIEEGERKLIAKQLDLLVANNVLSDEVGFEVDENEVVLLRRNADVEAWPRMMKEEVAVRLVKTIESEYSLR